MIIELLREKDQLFFHTVPVFALLNYIITGYGLSTLVREDQTSLLNGEWDKKLVALIESKELDL